MNDLVVSISVSYFPRNMRNQITYKFKYITPKGMDGIIIKADDECLTELLFLGSRKESIDSKQYTREKAPVIEDTIR